MASRHPTSGSARARVVVGFAAADGLAYGLRLLETLADEDVETHVVVSREAAHALSGDGDRVRALAGQVYAPENQAARISSGSFLTRGMIVAPCSAGSVSAIVMGLATNLVYRAADVTLKEHRPLLLAVPSEDLERVPEDIRARAADVPGLGLVQLEGPAEEAALALAAQLGAPGVV
jgi:flavin prenyltransferase